MTRSVVVALVGVLALAGCTADEDPSPEPTSAPSPTDAGPPPPPVVGSCHRLTVQEATAPADQSEPVDCSRRHTTRTIHVGRLEALGQGELARTCLAERDEFLGGTPEARRLSRFEVVWFSPTPKQVDAGADWYRCDVLAFGAADRLLPLSTDRRLRGVLDRPESLETFGLCGTARPGSPGFERVACGLRHTWVAIATIPVPGGQRYPGTATVRGAGDGACSDQVRERNETLLQFDYGWEWPTHAQWRAGQRHGYCWAPADLA